MNKFTLTNIILVVVLLLIPVAKSLAVIYEARKNSVPAVPSLPVNGPTHFTAIWQGQNPYQPMNIIVTSAQFEGTDLEIDDEIGIFNADSTGAEICVGVGVVSGTISATNPFDNNYFIRRSYIT